MTITRPIWMWYGRDTLEGRWTVGVVVMPGYGPRVMWDAVGLVPVAIITQAPNRPAFAGVRVTPPRIPFTLARYQQPTQQSANAGSRNVGGGGDGGGVSRARSPSPATRPTAPWPTWA